jgi:hypothetical protein
LRPYMRLLRDFASSPFGAAGLQLCLPHAGKISRH